MLIKRYKKWQHKQHVTLHEPQMSHRLNTVWGRQPRKPTWEHHETSAIRHALICVFKIQTNPQNTIHLWFFFPLSSFSMNKDKKREACHLWGGPLKTTQSLWDHQVRFWFYSPYQQHNTRRLQNRMLDFPMLIYLYIYKLARRTKLCFLYLSWRCNAATTTTTAANPSNVPQRGLARGRDLDERGDLKQSLSP